MGHSFLEWDEAAFHSHSEEELTGAPFGDTAPVRVFSFGVLGQQWRVQCRNESAAVTAAEEFCAAEMITRVSPGIEHVLIVAGVVRRLRIVL